MPISARLNTLTAVNESIYLLDEEGHVHASTNGSEWNKINTGYTVKIPVSYTHLLEEEAHTLNRAFFVNQLFERPYVILKWAQSRDGFMDRIRNCLLYTSELETVLVTRLKRCGETGKGAKISCTKKWTSTPFSRALR